MMKKALTVMVLTGSQLGTAALPPRYQNERDLDAMVSWIKSNERVLTTLNSIDFRGCTVRYADDCKAVFHRRQVVHPAGWAGPAEPLKFSYSTCGGKRTRGE